MTHDPDLAREIFISAGATRIRIEEYTPGHWLAASREHGAGVTSDKDEAFDTVQEVAAHLVGQKTAVSNASDSSGPRGDGADDDLDGGEATPPRQPQQGLSEDEAHGEAGGDTGASEGWLSDAESALGSDAGGVSAESASPENISGTTEEPSSDEAGFSEAPIDADFSDASESAGALEGEDLADPPALEFGAEMAEHEEAVDTGSVAYFGDDLPTMRLKKMGRLAQIAAEKTTAELAFANWSDDEFNAVQSHVVSNLNKATGAYTGDRQDLYNRFVDLSQAQAMVATINRHRDVSIAYINATDTPRLMVEQFDPEAGWP